MAVLRPVEMKLVDDLFGMSSGWVLDFSNRTFEEFFRHEVGIENYDDAYGFIGTSKGKHLSAFLQTGQPVAVVKALTALWEYRQEGFISRGDKDTVNGGRERLSAVLQRLGGKPLPDAGLPDESMVTAAKHVVFTCAVLRFVLEDLQALKPWKGNVDHRMRNYVEAQLALISRP